MKEVYETPEIRVVEIRVRETQEKEKQIGNGVVRRIYISGWRPQTATR